MTIIALIVRLVKRRIDMVDILGFDVAGKLSDDIAKNTAMVSNIVMAYPTLSPLHDQTCCVRRRCELECC
jgi:hypothetical protein